MNETDTPASPPPDIPDATMENLPELLREAARAQGWTSLMPVQAKAIPRVLSGRNMMIQARTGSGKTGAFLLPMLRLLDPEKKCCQALILVPTRELAVQVSEDARSICEKSGLSSLPVYGGVGYGAQNEGFREGRQIVIGTPGRIIDHLTRRNFVLEDLKMLVFDEADRMLDMGFYPDMKQVQRFLPRRTLHACMFSATFPTSVRNTALEFIDEPEFLSLSEDAVHVTDTEHISISVSGVDKDRTLIRLIEMENPQAAIIFCNTKSMVSRITSTLKSFGYNADGLSSDLSQKDRERVLGLVRKGTLRFLVATDVASRGLDIPEVSHVFLFEPPQDPEDYIHRAGRTSRAGAKGTAISLVYAVETNDLSRITQRYGIDMIQRPAPTDEDVEATVSERVMNLLEAKFRKLRPILKERTQRFVPLGKRLAELENDSPLLAMLLDDFYQQTLHGSAPEGPAKEKPRPRSKPRGEGGGRDRGRKKRRKPRRS